MAELSRRDETVRTERAQTQQTEEEEHSFKGTFVSVLMVGGVIIVSWFAVFFLFLSRQ